MARRTAALAALLLATMLTLSGVAVGEPSDVSVAAPSITVTPSTALVHLQSVTVSGTGLAPTTDYVIRQCEAGADNATLDCALGGPTLFFTSDASGGFSESIVVRRALRAAHAFSYDCVATPGACELAVVEGPNTVVVGQPITFDPSVPAPVLPSVAVDPSTDLLDGQVVAVDASGFAVDSQLVVVICRSGVTESFGCANARVVTADAAGEVHIAFTVRREVIGGFSMIHSDCAAAPYACTVFVGDFFDPLIANGVPVTFDPDVPLPDSTLHASPLSDLVDGQVVTITGTRPSGESLAAAQCGAGQSGNDNTLCSQATIRFGSTDGAGNFRLDFPVTRVISTPSGPIDCGAAPGACVVIVARLQSNGEVTRFSLSFLTDDAVAPAPILLHPAFTG